jgi:hypothetical protein
MESVEQGERVVVRPRLESSSSDVTTNGRLELMSLRDELADIGERIKKLQEGLSGLPAGAAPPPDALQQLWSLLWQLRPFLFLASTATVCQWKIGRDVFQQHHRRSYVKDAAHVAIALRLYVVLLRFTVICPAAAVHGCLTLLSVFAVINDPRLRTWKDSSERVQDVILFLLRAMHASDASAFAGMEAVMRQLLSEVAAHFDDVQTNAMGQPHTALFLDLSVQPSEALVSQAEPLLATISSSATPDHGGSASPLFRDVFCAHVCVETAYEARCIQTGLLQLLVRLVEQKVIFYVARDTAVLLCDTACHLVSSAVPGVEGGAANRVQHEVAWYAIRFLSASHELLAHVHGPLLLSVLIAQWQSPSSTSVFDVKVAEKSVFEWLSCLSEAELLSLTAAVERTGSGGTALPLTMCLAQMWSIAVRWCLELYNCTPSYDPSVITTQCLCCAMSTLEAWVTLCERFFRCTVMLSSTTCEQDGSNGTTQTAEYMHCLQLLANELPLSSITAALLCSQAPPVPVGDVQDDMMFLPQRILSFFAIPALPLCIATVLDEAKNRVDASAFRLVDANTLSVLALLPPDLVVQHHGRLRFGVQAFRVSLGETVQVLQRHESPSYPLLLQALVTLLHFFPHCADAAGASVADTMPRIMQELDVALTTCMSSQLALTVVPTPLWGLLYNKAAAVLFRVGSGLSWSRKALQAPENAVLLRGGRAAEALVNRVAGITEALQGSLMCSLSSLMANHGAASSALIVTSTVPVVEAEDDKLQRLRRSYEGLVNVLAIAVHLFAVMESVLGGCVELCITQCRANAVNSHGDGKSTSLATLVAATTLLTSVAALQLRLLEAKYTFSCIAGSISESAQSPAAGTHDSKSRSRGGRKQSSPKKKGVAVPTATMVVDVDVDDDDNDNEKHATEKSTLAAKDVAAVATNAVSNVEESSTSLPQSASKTFLLERIIEIHRTQLLPAAISAVQAVVVSARGANFNSSSSTANAAAEGQRDGRTADGVVDDDKVEVVLFRAALLRFTYTTIALAPPAQVTHDIHLCFSLSTVALCGGKESGVAHTLGPIAAREMVLWSSPEKAVSVANASLSQQSVCFLQWLWGTDSLRSLLSANAESSSVATVARGMAEDAIDFLWLARRCFQTTRATATATPLPEQLERALVLSTAAMQRQEACFLASEFAAQEARGWLALCFDVYGVYRAVRSEANDTAVAVMGLCVETARDVMAAFAWSATDLLRFRERPFVFSSFLKAVVDKEDRDMRVVLSASLDVLGRYLISADGVDSNGRINNHNASSSHDIKGWDGTAFSTAAATFFLPGDAVTRARLKRLMEREGITEWSTIAGAVAYVLYECSGRPLAKQVQYLAEVMSYVDKNVKDLPVMARSSKHVIAFHLVSLEADAQLLARERRRRSGRERRSSLPLLVSDTLAEHLGTAAHRLFLPAHCSGVNPCENENKAAAAAATSSWLLPNDASDEIDYLDSIAFSVFERAVEQLVTLCESTDSAAAVEGALRTPVGRSVAAEELWKSMFAVLDSIYKAFRIEPAAHYSDDGAAVEEAEMDGAPGSLRTRRRWLLGLASFIRFMGPQTTPIALMLPTLLERCSQLPSLVPFVCLVWRELVCACTEEYLAESAPSIALSLVSLEQQASPQAESRLLLASALQHLYKRTESAGFWDAYKVVLSANSELVALVLRARKVDEETRVDTGEAQERDLTRAGELLSGFIEVMRSGSLQSSTVFVRALYQYLSTADSAHRVQLTRAASLQPDVIQTLLQCAEVTSESAVYAMRCISIIGAVTAPPTGVVAARSRHDKGTPPAATNEGGDVNGPSSSLPHSSSSINGAWTSMSHGQTSYLDAETVLNWRKFSFTLLREYFPRVFASTADPVLHNCIAFAVQELIRASTMQERLLSKGVKLRSEDVVHVDELERYTWWACLTPHVKQLLCGFTTTRYSLTVNWKTRLRAPEYTPNLSYRRWLFNFFNHLVVSCGGWFAEMVQPLRNVAKRNSPLILYLLPYLVVHLLEAGKLEDEQYLECEMKTVLEATVGGQSRSSLSLRSQSLYESHPDAVPLHEPREHAHTILSILEDVEQLRWAMLRNRGRIPCTFAPQEPTESVCIHLSERYGGFLSLVPWTLRCRAALKIGSHIRALRSVEGQRRIPNLATVIGAVPLQRIFAALGDRESSRSIHRASPGLSLEDTAFSFENNGDWLAALGSSELVLQHCPFSGQHQLTALHCMNELGELYMTSRYASSLLAAASPGTLRGVQPAVGEGDPTRCRGSTTFSQLDAGCVDRYAHEDAADLRSRVQAYANEAAWRLGQWDSLLSDELPTSSAILGNSTSISLAMPAAFLHRELTGQCALPRVRAVTDIERLKIVPMVRTPCQEDLTTQGYTFTLLLHALGDVDAVSDVLCANISILDKDGSPRADRDNRSVGVTRSRGSCRPTPSRISSALLPSAVKDEIISLLSLRESYVEDTISAREPLLALHRMVYRELGVPQKVAETWLKQSELLRNAGLGEAALTAARQAAYECPEHIVHTNYYTLVAHLLHDTQSATPAMEFARECLDDKRIPATTRAQLQMLLTDWLVETGSERPERVFAEYNKARELDRRSELVHYQMAVFSDHLHTLTTNASENAAAQLTTASPTPAMCSPAGGAVGAGSGAHAPSSSTAAFYSAVLLHQKEMVESIEKYALPAIEHFGEALLRGTEKASVSLPRMLTLWLDSAAFLGGLMATTAGKLDGSAAGVLDTMNAKVRSFILNTAGATIPPGVVMTALPQLLSRLAHPVASVRCVLTDVVVHLLNCFPQQCLWLVLPMALSKEGPKEIVETQIIKPFADNSCNERVLRYAKILCDTLLAICNCSANLFPKESGLAQLSPVQKINPMLPEAHFILPVLSNLTPDIHADELNGVFPTSPCFHHFEDRVIVMRSLQKPKRIWVATSEGREMSFLCKSKDEPRKDIRMMEVATLMNSFFLSDPEARRKRFSLRRYSVTALSDDCAVIEWLNDTTTLAKVAMECYSLDRSGVHISSVKKWVALVDEKKLSKKDLFTKYILPEAPPVMHQWLDRTFSSNQSWYEARKLFTQSTALWSIAGHIVGLGDRHAENLMIDMSRGELMHVDFACMFDKGEKLEVPEQVRFRLTQNLTDVMGVLGAYGPFQATCEVALRCEMKNKSAVMSIVETLLHEPLVEWRRQSSRSSAANGPRQLMERVARRLDGFLDLYSVPPQRDTLALNVESQVAKLIHHSSDLDNLSQMYIWWMAWI